MVREELLALKHRLSIEVEMQQQAARPPTPLPHGA